MVPKGTITSVGKTLSARVNLAPSVLWNNAVMIYDIWDSSKELHTYPRQINSRLDSDVKGKTYMLLHLKHYIARTETKHMCSGSVKELHQIQARFRFNRSYLYSLYLHSLKLNTHACICWSHVKKLHAIESRLILCILNNTIEQNLNVQHPAHVFDYNI